MSKQTGPQGGFDAATHASVTGGEVRSSWIDRELARLDWLDEDAARKEAQRRWNEYNTREVNRSPVGGSLHSRPTGEAEAWRDGWRAAMSCAVLVAETARAPAAVGLLREQLEPPV